MRAAGVRDDLVPNASAGSSSMLPRRTGYIVLIALAWFQVAFASHQFEHVTGDLFEACTVCKHMERHDSAVVQNPAESVPFVRPFPAAATPAVPASAKLLRAYESRAPPSA